MHNFLNRTREFLISEDGPAATEYAVMLALIVLVAVGSISDLGLTVSRIFEQVSEALPSSVQ